MTAMPRQGRARRHIALLGVAAMLLQALLFGWHHHPLPVPSRGAAPFVAAPGATPVSPLADADDCDICAALHHLTAAPGDIVALVSPPPAPAPAAVTAIALPR